MKRKLTVIAVIIAILSSLISFSVPAREDASDNVYVSDFSFLGESDNTINTPEGKMKAAVAFESLSDIPLKYAFSIAAYSKGELKDMKTATGSITKSDGIIPVTTPLITVDSASCDEVHAILTTEDFSSLLAPMAVMGSNISKITEIFVGEDKIELKEGKTEYNLKKFLTADKFPVKIRVGRKELGQKITVDEITSSKQTVNITSVANNGEGLEEYKLNLELYQVNEASLTALNVGGNLIENFDPQTKEYIIKTSVGDELPSNVTATAYDPNANVSITPATKLPGTTVVTVTNGEKTEEYKLRFTKAVSTSIDSWASHRGKGQIENIATEGGEDYITLCSYASIDSNKVSGDSRINYYAFTLPETEGEIVGAELSMKFKYNPGGNYVYYQYTLDDMDTFNVRSYPVWKGFDNHNEAYRLGEYHDASGGVGTITLDGSKLKFKSMGDGNMRTVILAEKLYEGNAALTYLFNPVLTVYFAEEDE